MTEIDSMEFWMQQLSNRDVDTRRNYKIYLLKFVEWIGKGPNELIEMKKQSLEHNGDRRENMVLEGKVKEFMNYLEYDAVTLQGRKGYRLGSRKIAYSAIVSFFQLNQYPLSMNRGDRLSGDALGSRIPEDYEIVKLVNTAKSRRHRAVILFLKDSGLRLSDVVKLEWEDIKDFGEGFHGFKLITQKRKVKGLPFIGPEASQALNQLPRKKTRIFPITAKWLSNALALLIDEAKLEKGLSPHGLRKFFNVELQNARVPKEHRYAMMGKKLGAYDENRQRELFKIYKTNYDSLRIFGIVRQDEEIAELHEKLREKDLELQSLKHDIAELQSKENDLIQAQATNINWLKKNAELLEKENARLRKVVLRRED